MSKIQADRSISTNGLLREVLRRVDQSFFDHDVARKVIEGCRKQKLTPALDSRALIDDLLTRLGASHTARFTADEVAYYEALSIYAQSWISKRRLRRLFPPHGVVEYDGIGLRTTRAGERFFASAVYEGGPAWRAGILRGDELLDADGQPFAEIASFSGKSGRGVRVGLRRRRGSAPENVTVRPERLRPDELFSAATLASVDVHERGGRRIGYVRAWSYAGDRYHELLRSELSSGRLAEADALVLDLRGGWGGASPQHAELYAGATPTMSFIDRAGVEHLASFRWCRPVVALIDVETRSGKEVLAFALRRAGVPLVGQRSAGAVLGATAWLLSDGSLLLIASHDVLVDGERLEGRGLDPDVFVPFDLPYSGGNDPARETAIDVAVELSSGGADQSTFRSTISLRS